MKKYQTLSGKEKTQYIGILYPFLLLFGWMGKTMKLFGTKSRKIIASVLSFTMILTILPTVNLTAFAAAEPDMSIGLDFTNCDSDWTGTGAYEGVVWAYDSKTLTLTNATIHGADSNTAIEIYGLKLPNDTKIVLNGANTVKSGIASADNARNYGIYALGLTISGTGSLVTIGGPSTGTGITYSYGLATHDCLTINSGTVTAIGGSAVYSTGIVGNMTINGGIVNVIGGYATSMSFGCNAAVNINGGLLTAKSGVAPTKMAFTVSPLDGTNSDILTGATESNFCVVGSSSVYKVLNSVLDFSAVSEDTGTLATDGYSWTQSTKTLTVKNLVLNAPALHAIILPDGAILDVQGINVVRGKDTSSTYDVLSAVYSTGALTIQNSGVLNAFAGGGTTSFIRSYGIFAAGNISISNTSINAFGGTSTWNSHGIYQQGSSNLVISSGNILGVGGTQIGSNSFFSAGLCTNYSSVTVSDGDVTAIGGEVNLTGGTSTVSTGFFGYYAPTISGGNIVAIGSAATSGVAQGKSNAIFINAGGYPAISGGKVTAIGQICAVNYPYSLSNFETVTLASTNIDGSGPVSYNPADIKTYKYTKIAVTKTNLTAANFNTIATTVTYDGSPKSVTPTYASGITAVQAGTITTYYTGAGDTSYSTSTTPPTNAGTYDVFVTTDGGIGYNALDTQTKVGTLTINKITPTIYITSNPTSGQSRPNPLVLSADLPADATGTLQFKTSGNNIGTPVSVGESVSFTASGTVDKYIFSVLYSGDTNHFPAASGNLLYGFLKGEQTALSFTAETPTAKTYGDSSFAVTATGGSSTGEISYSVVSGPATISGNTVTLTGAGSVVLRATKAGDDDYNAITADTTITVGKKSVTIIGVTAKNKTYDGTATTGISGAPYINGRLPVDEVGIFIGSATFADKTVGNGKTVAFTGFTLSGTDADKYVLTEQPADVTANIAPKPITADVTIQNKAYDGLNTAVISGTSLNGVLPTDAVSLVTPYPTATFSDVSAANNIAISFSDNFTLTGADMGNYTLTQPSRITGNITNNYNAVKGTDYICGNNEWSKNDFIVTAKNGFELSLTNTANGVWNETLVCSDETASGNLVFYVRNQATGAISVAVSEGYKIDKTAPIGDIKIGENSIKKALNTITFGLFFKETQSIKITSADTGSGVKSVKYSLSSSVWNSSKIGEIPDWTPYTGAFTIEPNSQTVVYVEIIDAVGNVTYLGSDGLVLDSNAPVISDIENGKSYCAAVTLTVTDANLDTVTVNGIATTLTDGRLTLSPTGTEQIVVATDKAGNSTTVTATVYDGHTWDVGVINTLPTASEKGLKTYTCIHCGETQTEEIAMLAPTVTEGQDGNWNPDEGGTLTFKSDAAFSDFIRVLVDGNEIDEKTYELKEGSIIVMLKADYLATLPAGTHTLGIESATGTASTEFTVTAKTEEEPPSKPDDTDSPQTDDTDSPQTGDTDSPQTGDTDSPQTGDTDSPQTGDNSNILLWVALLFVSGGALTVFGIKRRKRKAVR